MQKLLEYNAFGLVSISREKITASVTVVSGSRSISRSVADELDKPLQEVQDNESVAITFGAWLEPGKQSRITAHEIGELKSGALVGEIAQVKQVIQKAIELTKKAAQIE
jgi:hypothetical protein